MSLLLLQKRRAMMKQFAWNTMTGTGSLTLLNGLKASFKELKLIGNSVQGYTVKVLSGELEQGTVSIVDGANVASNYRVRTKDFLDIEKGKYKVTCEGAKQGNVIFYDKNGTFQKALFDAHTVFPFVLTAEEACKIKVVVSNGTEAEQIAITPNNVKSITVATEISSEYRQEIKSVGRKSKNLFNIEKIKDVNNYVTSTYGYIAFPIDVEIGKTYTFNRNKNNGYGLGDKYNCGFKTDKDGSITNWLISNSNNTLNVSKTSIIAKTNKIYFCIMNSVTNEELDTIIKTCFLNAQLELGNIATPYEPYGKYLIDVQMSGRNLFDVDAVRNENGYLNSDIQTALDTNRFNVVEGRQYLLISKGRVLTGGTGYSSPYFGEDDLKYGTNHLNILGLAAGNNIFTGKIFKRFLVAKKSATITKFIIHGYNVAKDAYEVEEMGLFETANNNANIEYEPYKEPQTTQIALDEPLRGIGNYKDVITKDGILRRIKEIVLDENTGFTNHLGEIQNKTICFATHILKDATKISALNNAMSDKIEKVTYVDGQDKECFTLFNKQIYIKLNRERNVDTVEKLKEWLKQNPIKVQYVLQEQIVEPLQTELGNLHTYNGTTCIYTDSGEVQTGIEATYKSNRREKNE